jgi:hypothetical protein
MQAPADTGSAPPVTEEATKRKKGHLFELNFYRIHWLFFTIHPLIWSGIFYGVNGRYHIPYIDCLFLCFSSQTVTGLSSVNLSTLTGFQQAILFWCVLLTLHSMTHSK